MQRVIHFRILIDHDEDVFRDIELNASDTFHTLHNLIQEAFGFANDQMASFYVSNEDWEKGQEIALLEVKVPEESGEPIWLMEDTPLSKIIFEKDQKLLYVFDFLLMWCFYIDVISVKTLEETVILPRITHSFGTAPDQYAKSTEVLFNSESITPWDDEDIEEDELEALFRMMGDNVQFN